jgi:hypothetical protein
MDDPLLVSHPSYFQKIGSEKRMHGKKIPPQKSKAKHRGNCVDRHQLLGAARKTKIETTTDWFID